MNDPKRELAYRWFDMTPQERALADLPAHKTALMQHLSISKDFLRKMESEYYAEKLGKQLAQAEIVKPEVEEVVDLDFDPAKWFKETKQERYEALLRACKAGNAQAMKLASQLANELVEKQEIKIGLSADEIARRNLEAERQLREGGYA